MKIKKEIILIPIILLIAVFVFYKGNNVFFAPPKEVYEVSLGTEKIGYLSSKEELIDYFDEKESALKVKYNVDNVYLPKDLNIEKVITYNPEIRTAEKIYDDINKKVNATVKGYEVIIKGVNDKNIDGEQVYKDTVRINVLDKKLFNDALKVATSTYINEELYNDFINGKDTLATKKIEYTDINFSNNITIREKNIPVTEDIYTNVEDLSSFLLFKTNENENNYLVKEGDTIEDVALNNGLSVQEFMIANPEIKSENKLLYEGEKLSVKLVKPAFVLNEQFLKEEVKTINYETEVRKDNTMKIGTEKVIQEGSNGTAIVLNEYSKRNGYIMGVVPKNTEIVTKPVNKVVLQGTKQPEYGSWISDYPIAMNGNYVWPTAQPYIITSEFGPRWGKLHTGTDISGPGHGSPIFSVTDGIVMGLFRVGSNLGGNEVHINHGNGLCTNYAHLSHINVGVGEVVKRGQIIGGMGKTGLAFGVHLHFGVARCAPGQMGRISMSAYFNPRNLYR